MKAHAHLGVVNLRVSDWRIGIADDQARPPSRWRANARFVALPKANVLDD